MSQVHLGLWSAQPVATVRQVFFVAEFQRLSEFCKVLVLVPSGLLLLGTLFGFLQARLVWTLQNGMEFIDFTNKDGWI